MLTCEAAVAVARVRHLHAAALQRLLNCEFREFLNGCPMLGAVVCRTCARAASQRLYAMTRLIRMLTDRASAAGSGSCVLPLPDSAALTITLVLCPFTPSNPNELALKANEIVAIANKLDPRTGAEVDLRMEIGSPVSSHRRRPSSRRRITAIRS